MRLDEKRRRRINARPEAALLRAIMAYLRSRNMMFLRLNAGRQVLTDAFGKNRVFCGVSPGTPDLVVLRDGGGVTWIEVKSQVGRLSDKQMLWHSDARQHGHRVHVARSVQDVIHVLAASP